MKRFLKIFLIILGVLLLVLLSVYLVADWKFNNKAKKKYTYQPIAYPVNTKDSVMINRGKRVADIYACTECHGKDLSGKILADDFMLGTISGSNITKGKGGLPADYGAEDWFRVLQHGTKRQGYSVMGMPVKEVYQLTKSDMAALVSYMMSLPPKDHELPAIKPGPVLKIMTFLDQIKLFSVEEVDHTFVQKDNINTNSIDEYGAYLTQTCQGCHGKNFTGPETEIPGVMPAPAIDSKSRIVKAGFDQFKKTVTAGIKPDGQKLSSEMPWQQVTAKMTDAELRTIFEYLKKY